MSLLRCYSTRLATPSRHRMLPCKKFGKLKSRVVRREYTTQLPPAPPDPTPEYSGAKKIQEQFSRDVLRALQTLGKVFAWMGYGTMVAGLIGVTVFEAGHVWVEQQMKVKPDEDAKRWGWQADDWTGGEYGGTSSKLGLVGRHSVRAAWFALNYGTPFLNALGMFSGQTPRAGKVGGGGMLTYADQDLESASLYLEDAISRMGNWKGGAGGKAAAGDEEKKRVMVTLFERYASVQELLGTAAALVKAYRSYLLVYSSKLGDPIGKAQVAIKLGNLSERLEDEEAALDWWERGMMMVLLAQSDTTDTGASDFAAMGVGTVATAAADRGTWSPLMSKVRQWTHGGEEEEGRSQGGGVTQGLEGIADRVSDSPVGQRTLVRALLELSVFFSRRGHLEQAKHVEEETLGLIEALTGTTAKGETGGEILHKMYLMHRKAVVTLHHAEVTHALETRKQKPEIEKVLANLLTAASLSEVVSQQLGQPKSQQRKSLTAVNQLCSAFADALALRSSAQRLLRDARLTAMEAWDLAGILHQDSGEHEKAAMCFERALTWAGQPGDEGIMISLADWESLSQRFLNNKSKV